MQLRFDLLSAIALRLHSLRPIISHIGMLLLPPSLLDGSDNRSTRLPAIAGIANQLIFDRSAPAGLPLRPLVLRPGDGLRVQIFLRLRGYQFDRLGLTLGFDRPGFRDLEVFQIDSPPFSG